MAVPEVPLKNGEMVKVRNPVTSAVLDVVTFGIYGIFWYFYVNREMSRLGRVHGTTELGENPTNSVLAVVPGFILIVPTIITYWNTSKRAQAAQRVAGAPEPSLNNVLAFILMLFLFPVAIWYVQSELNKVWATEAEAPPLPA
jgi:hypothetical protein